MLNGSIFSNIDLCGFARIISVPVLLLASGACTSIKAVQRPITAADITPGFICPSNEEIQENERSALQGVARGQHRDRVIMGCIKAINKSYGAFKLQMHEEKTGFALGTDLVALGATTGATFAGKKLAQRLTAGAAFSIGAGASIEKNVFYQLTLPAIEASMDARRDKILTSIINAQKADPNGERFTLAMAGYELDALQAAGNIYAAVSDLTKAAGAVAEVARKERVDAEEKAYDLGTFKEMDKPVLQSLDALVQKIRGMSEPADSAALDVIAAKLEIVKNDAEPFEERQSGIVLAIKRQLQELDTAADQQSFLTELGKLLPAT